MRQTAHAVTALLVAAAVLGGGCSGKDASRDQAESVLGPSVSGQVAMTTASPAPSPLPSAGPGGIAGAATCPVSGKGSVSAACSKKVGTLFPQVDAIVEQVIHQRPELFDLTRYVGPSGSGGYLVRDQEAFYNEVVTRLQAAGVCAYYDFTRFLLQVKDSNASSEDYALILSNGHLRRGEGSYLSTCLPAAFPLEPSDIIDDIRVAFYSIECPDGAPPRNGEGKLRMECVGIVTATPKKADNTDVHSRIHGPDISWTLEQIDDYVDLSDFPGQPFNKYVKGLDPGFFSLCATVQGVKGCLRGEVLHEVPPAE
jgi:hypothetical protein